MNNHIFELATTAKSLASDEISHSARVHNRILNAEECEHVYTRVFADLVVKECIASIEKTIETTCKTDDEKMGCEYAITDLTDRFEIK